MAAGCWAAYSASSFDWVGHQWQDISGHSRDITEFSGPVLTPSETIKFSGSQGCRLPKNSIPQAFTLCMRLRYDKAISKSLCLFALPVSDGAWHALVISNALYGGIWVDGCKITSDVWEEGKQPDLPGQLSFMPGSFELSELVIFDRHLLPSQLSLFFHWPAKLPRANRKDRGHKTWLVCGIQCPKCNHYIMSCSARDVVQCFRCQMYAQCLNPFFLYPSVWNCGMLVGNVSPCCMQLSDRFEWDCSRDMEWIRVKAIHLAKRIRWAFGQRDIYVPPILVDIVCEYVRPDGKDKGKWKRPHKISLLRKHERRRMLEGETTYDVPVCEGEEEADGQDIKTSNESARHNDSTASSSSSSSSSSCPSTCSSAASPFSPPISVLLPSAASCWTHLASHLECFSLSSCSTCSLPCQKALETIQKLQESKPAARVLSYICLIASYISVLFPEPFLPMFTQTGYFILSRQQVSCLLAHCFLGTFELVEKHHCHTGCFHSTFRSPSKPFVLAPGSAAITGLAQYFECLASSYPEGMLHFECVYARGNPTQSDAMLQPVTFVQEKESFGFKMPTLLDYEARGVGGDVLKGGQRADEVFLGLSAPELLVLLLVATEKQDITYTVHGLVEYPVLFKGVSAIAISPMLHDRFNLLTTRTPTFTAILMTSTPIVSLTGMLHFMSSLTHRRNRSLNLLENSNSFSHVDAPSIMGVEIGQLQPEPMCLLRFLGLWLAFSCGLHAQVPLRIHSTGGSWLTWLAKVQTNMNASELFTSLSSAQQRGVDFHQHLLIAASHPTPTRKSKTPFPPK